MRGYKEMRDSLLERLVEDEKLKYNVDFCDKLAAELHTFYICADNMEHKIMKIIGKSHLDPDVVLMPVQLDILQKISQVGNFVISAPTSFGKSFLVLEYIKRLKQKLHLIIYIVHTKSLCNEVTNNFKKYFGEEYNVINDFEEIDKENNNNNNILIMISDGKNVFDFDYVVDLLIVDEAYNLDKKHSGTRFLSIYYSYKKILSKATKSILIGPFIKKLVGDEAQKYNLIQTDYSPVSFKIYEGEKLFHLNPTDCFVENIKKRENTIGFINSKSKIYQEIKKILDLDLPDVYNDSFIKWMEDYFPSFWMLPKLMKKGISIYHSSFPAYINLYTMKKFNDGVQKGLLTTSALLEGVNTSAKNIVIYGTKYNNEELTPFQFFNLCGRAGRLNREIVGSIFNFGEGYNDLYDKKALELYIGSNPSTAEEEFDIGLKSVDSNVYKDKIIEELNRVNINFDDWYEEFKFYFSKGEDLLALLSIYNDFKIEFKKKIHSDLLTKDYKRLNKNLVLDYIYKNFVGNTKYKYQPASKYYVPIVLAELLRSNNNGIDFKLKQLCTLKNIKNALDSFETIEEKNQYIVEIMRTGYEYIPYNLFYCSTILNEFIQHDLFFDENEKIQFYNSYYVRLLVFLKCDTKKNAVFKLMSDRGILPTIISKVENYIQKNNIELENLYKKAVILLIRNIIQSKIFLEEYELLNLENIKI